MRSEDEIKKELKVLKHDLKEFEKDYNEISKFEMFHSERIIYITQIRMLEAKINLLKWILNVK